MYNTVEFTHQNKKKYVLSKTGSVLSNQVKAWWPSVTSLGG